MYIHCTLLFRSMLGHYSPNMLLNSSVGSCTDCESVEDYDELRNQQRQDETWSGTEVIVDDDNDEYDDSGDGNGDDDGDGTGDDDNDDIDDDGGGGVHGDAGDNDVMTIYIVVMMMMVVMMQVMVVVMMVMMIKMMMVSFVVKVAVV